MSTDYGYFRTQHGLITTTQAHKCHLTAAQIQHRLGTGEWINARRGVYRHAATRPGWHSRVLAEVLGRRAVASHRTAAVLHNLGIFREPRPEVTVPYGTRLSGSGIHVTTQWDLRDETTRHGIACTGIERTILDCGAVVNLQTIERLAEAAIRQDLTSWGRLATSLIGHSVQGRNGCGLLRTLLQAREGQTTVPLSDFSRLMVNLLVDAGVPRPEIEYSISDIGGRHILAADLAWPDLKKAWELDGLAYHFGRTEAERDKRKRNRAKCQGWSIQEIVWSMYVEDPQELVEMARAFLAA